MDFPVAPPSRSRLRASQNVFLHVWAKLGSQVAVFHQVDLAAEDVFQVGLRLVWASFLGVLVEPRQNVDVAVFRRLVPRGGAEQGDVQDAEPLGQRSLMLAKQP